MDTTETGFFYAVISSCLVIAAMLASVFLLLSRLWKRNLEWHRLKNMAETSAAEKERGRIANDLHDEIAPFLNAIKFKMDHLPHQSEKELVQKNEIGEHLDEVLGRVREISFNLVPAALLRTGLIAAIKFLVEQVKEKYKIDVGLNIQHTFFLADSDSVHVLRIMQEVMHNVVKHSKAAQVLVVFTPSDDKLIFTVRDNGIGFDYEAKLDEGGGLGLKSIQKRVLLLNGKMSLQSKKGEGTRYFFEIPLGESGGDTAL